MKGHAHAVDPRGRRPARGEVPGRALRARLDEPLDLLVATILAAQCTDERVNRVTGTLFPSTGRGRDYAGPDRGARGGGEADGLLPQRPGPSRAVPGARGPLRRPRPRDDGRDADHPRRGAKDGERRAQHGLRPALGRDCRHPRGARLAAHGPLRAQEPERHRGRSMRLVPARRDGRSSARPWCCTAATRAPRAPRVPGPARGPVPEEARAASPPRPRRQAAQAREQAAAPRRQGDEHEKARPEAPPRPRRHGDQPLEAPDRGCPPSPRPGAPCSPRRSTSRISSELARFVAEERKAPPGLPARARGLLALELTPVRRRAASSLLGQDPYHDDEQAHGLCFSVRPGDQAAALAGQHVQGARERFGLPPPSHGHLVAWAKQPTGPLRIDDWSSDDHGPAHPPCPHPGWSHRPAGCCPLGRCGAGHRRHHPALHRRRDRGAGLARRLGRPRHAVGAAREHVRGTRRPVPRRRRSVHLRPTGLRRQGGRRRRVVLLLRGADRGASGLPHGRWLRRRRAWRRSGDVGGRGRGAHRGRRTDERRRAPPLRPGAARPRQHPRPADDGDHRHRPASRARRQPHPGRPARMGRRPPRCRGARLGLRGVGGRGLTRR